MSEARRKRLLMRSWRRGIRETDLILGPWAERNLDRLGREALEAYEALLSEPDPDLYAWLSGRAAAPERFAALIAEIAADHARTRQA
jgi:antitoxin CptB